MDLQSLFYTLGIIFLTTWLVVLAAGMVLIILIIRKVQALGYQAQAWSDSISNLTAKLNSKPIGVIATLLPLMPLIIKLLKKSKSETV